MYVYTLFLITLKNFYLCFISDMDYTKTYCIIERNRNDFIIFPTKYIYFEDDENRVLPISQATGTVKTFFAYENGRVKQIKKIINCSGKFIINIT